MNEQCVVNLRQSLEDGGVGSQFLANFDERTDHINAHGDGSVTVEYGGGHEGSVFGEDLGRLCATATAHRL